MKDFDIICPYCGSVETGFCGSETGDFAIEQEELTCECYDCGEIFYEADARIISHEPEDEWPGDNEDIDF